MSLTLNDLLVALEPFEGRLIRATRQATVADLVEILPTIGAEPGHWCEEHAIYGGAKRCQTGAQIAPDVCRMVSVLVLKVDE